MPRWTAAPCCVCGAARVGTPDDRGQAACLAPNLSSANSFRVSCWKSIDRQMHQAAVVRVRTQSISLSQRFLCPPPQALEEAFVLAAEWRSTADCILSFFVQCLVGGNVGCFRFLALQTVLLGTFLHLCKSLSEECVIYRGLEWVVPG